ncbi:ABC transporter ATP-binding protein [Candidatus Bathyarchaeota archaeon]|nr:ABC transporter ATP-binding protein [Candidatus Bathyarchaeota archaeon]
MPTTDMKAGHILEVDSLTVRYVTERFPVMAVEGVTLAVGRGEAFGLAGESGSGKSTLANTILRILPSNAEILSGRILFEGEDILKIAEEEFRRRFRWRRIAIVPQATMNSLTPVHRVNRQIVEAILTHEDVTVKEAFERAEALLENVGIPRGRARDYPHQFSGGMKQRAMIAMALACNPSLLITDEPTTGLDVITQAEVLKVLEDSKKRFNLSLILITHDLAIISELCERVAVMYAGRIVEEAPTKRILTHPAHPYTKALLEAYPDIEGPRVKLKPVPSPGSTWQATGLGCPFYPRCDSRGERCSEEDPKLIVVEDKHLCACHIY